MRLYRVLACTACSLWFWACGAAALREWTLSACLAIAAGPLIVVALGLLVKSGD